MAAIWFERILKQMLLIIAVLLITSAIALADVNRYQAVRLKELVVIDPKVFLPTRKFSTNSHGTLGWSF